MDGVRTQPTPTEGNASEQGDETIFSTKNYKHGIGPKKEQTRKSLDDNTTTTPAGPATPLSNREEESLQY
jgi:hypothetical protein